MLLMMLALTSADKQENTTWQESMPQSHASYYIDTEQWAAERSIEHLLNERIAITAPAIGEIPGYHPHHSKPKCLQTTDRHNRLSPSQTTDIGMEHHHSPVYHHVIDYYIYTLEHILI